MRKPVFITGVVEGVGFCFLNKDLFFYSTIVQKEHKWAWGVV